MKERIKGKLEKMYEENGEYCLVVSLYDREMDVVLSIPEKNYLNLKGEFDIAEKPIEVSIKSIIFDSCTN